MQQNETFERKYFFKKIKENKKPIIAREPGRQGEGWWERISRSNQKKVKKVKRRAGENPRKLIMHHLRPTHSAYAPSLHRLLFLLSLFRILLHASLPFLSQLRHPALHCVHTPTLLLPLWGRSRTLHSLALLLHAGWSVWAFCYSRYASWWVERQKHTHTHADIIAHTGEAFIYQPACKIRLI